MKNNYQKTVYACFVGYIVQAIINNFVPLLFITFEKSYHIPMSQITMLITFNFGIQLFVDFLSAKFVDKIGYRISVVLAHVFSATGLIWSGLCFSAVHCALAVICWRLFLPCRFPALQAVHYAVWLSALCGRVL